MPDLVLQIVGGATATVLATIIIASRKTLVVRPARYVQRRMMRLRCKVFKKHSMSF